MADLLTDKWTDPDYRHPDREPHTLDKLDKAGGVTVVLDTEKCPDWYKKAEKLIASCKHHKVNAEMMHPQNKIKIQSDESKKQVVNDIIQRNLFHEWYKIDGDIKLNLKIYDLEW